MSDTDEPRFEHQTEPQPVDALLYAKLLIAILLVGALLWWGVKALEPPEEEGAKPPATQHDKSYETGPEKPASTPLK